MRHLLLFVFVSGVLTLGYAQEDIPPAYYDDSIVEQYSITEDDLKPYRDNDDFDYNENKEEDTFIDKAIRWLQNILRQFWEAIFGVGTATGFLYFMFRILPYILLGVLVYLLIRFFLKVNSNSIIGKAEEKGTVNYSEEEQIIKHEDINALISDAIKQKNYRLAIRYYYLLSLKHLTDRQSIEWQPQKTNEDYINEITEPSLKFDFENITKIYDYVWYGEFDVNVLKFERLKLPFESLHKSITP